MKHQEYRFKIDAFTPETLPMKRLAQYMDELATLFGSQERVHFVRIEEGSATLVQEVEYEHVPKVKERLRGVKDRSAPQDAIEAYSNLDTMLAQDNTGGLIETDFGNKVAKIIIFPGKNRESVERFGPVSQLASVDGVLVRIGGTDETVPVLLLEEGKTRHHCNCNRDVARKLAPYLFGGMLRVYGTGKWQRDDFGNWVMGKFTIHNFNPLDEAKLSDVVSKLRSIPSEIQSLDDPAGELRRIRHGGDKVQ
jgi:hypothetical protein